MFAFERNFARNCVIFFFQSNSVKNSLKCPKAKSANHCITKLFPIYQNKNWTIRRQDNHTVVPLSCPTILYWRFSDFYFSQNMRGEGRGKFRRPWGYGLVVFSLAMISSSTIGPPPGSFAIWYQEILALRGGRTAHYCIYIWGWAHFWGFYRNNNIISSLSLLWNFNGVRDIQ